MQSTCRHRQLMVDTRNSIMAKWAPGKYGDEIHQEVEASGPTEAVPVIYIRSSSPLGEEAS